MKYYHSPAKFYWLGSEPYSKTKIHFTQVKTRVQYDVDGGSRRDKITAPDIQKHGQTSAESGVKGGLTPKAIYKFQHFWIEIIQILSRKFNVIISQWIDGHVIFPGNASYI